VYEKATTKNLYIKALEQRQTLNKFLEARNLLEAIELKPMTFKEKLSGYKLIILELLRCDTKEKLIYNIMALATLLVVFKNMLGALIELLKEGKISRALSKTLILFLRKKGLDIPEELEELSSE
jgi:hypothetical protein